MRKSRFAIGGSIADSDWGYRNIFVDVANNTQQTICEKVDSPLGGVSPTAIGDIGTFSLTWRTTPVDNSLHTSDCRGGVPQDGVSGDQPRCHLPAGRLLGDEGDHPPVNAVAFTQPLGRAVDSPNCPADAPCKQVSRRSVLVCRVHVHWTHAQSLFVYDATAWA